MHQLRLPGSKLSVKLRHRPRLDPPHQHIVQRLRPGGYFHQILSLRRKRRRGLKRIVTRFLANRLQLFHFLFGQAFDLRQPFLRRPGQPLHRAHARGFELLDVVRVNPMVLLHRENREKERVRGEESVSSIQRREDKEGGKKKNKDCKCERKCVHPRILQRFPKGEEDSKIPMTTKSKIFLQREDLNLYHRNVPKARQFARSVALSSPSRTRPGPFVVLVARSVGRFGFFPSSRS